MNISKFQTCHVGNTNTTECSDLVYISVLTELECIRSSQPEELMSMLIIFKTGLIFPDWGYRHKLLVCNSACTWTKNCLSSPSDEVMTQRWAKMTRSLMDAPIPQCLFANVFFSENSNIFDKAFSIHWNEWFAKINESFEKLSIDWKVQNPTISKIIDFMSLPFIPILFHFIQLNENLSMYAGPLVFLYWAMYVLPSFHVPEFSDWINEGSLNNWQSSYFHWNIERCPHSFKPTIESCSRIYVREITCSLADTLGIDMTEGTDWAGKLNIY